MMQRNDGRAPDEIRPINFELNVAPHASGSVLVSHGQNAGDLLRHDRRRRATLDERTGRDRWLAYCGIFDAARTRRSRANLAT